jgi:hypothetical protein
MIYCIYIVAGRAMRYIAPPNKLQQAAGVGAQLLIEVSPQF